MELAMLGMEEVWLDKRRGCPSWTLGTRWDQRLILVISPKITPNWHDDPKNGILPSKDLHNSHCFLYSKFMGWIYKKDGHFDGRKMV